MPMDTLRGWSKVKEYNYKDDVGVKKYKHQFMEEMKSMCKSMIKRRGSMHENTVSQSFPLKEFECTLDSNMSKLLKFSIWGLMETKHKTGGCDPEFVNFHIKT